MRRDYSRRPLTHRDALEFSDGQIVLLIGFFEHRNSAPASSAIRYSSQAKA
jgi:hypothetical protein